MTDDRSARAALAAFQELFRAYYHTGTETKLDEAIKTLQHALTHELRDKEIRCAALSNLGAALLIRSKNSDSTQDLDLAIEISRLAANEIRSAHPYRAMALSNLAEALYVAGRKGESIAARRETVKVRRALVERNDDILISELAADLDALVTDLVVEFGPTSEVLALNLEAVDIHRRLSAQNDEQHASNLGKSLNNLSNRLGEVGRYEEAQAAAEEAVAIYQALAVAEPQVHQVHLAMSLNNWSHWLAEIGRWQEAVTAAEKALALYQTLSVVQPEVYRAYLEDSLEYLSGRIMEIERQRNPQAVVETVTSYVLRDKSSRSSRSSEIAPLNALASDASIGVMVAERVDESELRGRVSLAMQGDRDALESLFVHLRPMIVRYCRARLGRISGHYHFADDVAQEVCIAVLSELPRYYDAGRPFASFVFSIALRKVADALRELARTATPTEDLPDGPDDSLGPEEPMLLRAEAQRIHTLLSRLPDNQREVLILRVISGLSSEETGNVLGMSPADVRVTQHRALSRLRRLADLESAD